LHFGLLDLGGTLGRRFGGIGTAAPAPTLLVSARPSDALEAGGPDADRALEFARRFLAHTGVADAGGRGARICVHRTFPAHAGLGSGTQLALAVGRALAELHDIPIDPAGLAQAVGRARRSAVGTWTFAGGGLVLEGGRRSSAVDCVAPLLARLPFPPEWRCVVAVPDTAAAMNGTAEEAAFARLPPPSDADAARVAHLVVMALLPALAEADLPAFGEALTSIQSINGRWFAAVQGGTFAPGPSEALVRHFGEWGAAGVGQSSWGPTVYGIVEGADGAAQLADDARAFLARAGDKGVVYEGAFRTEGARVWREPPSSA
jgi:beta-RFAP synthase